MQIAVLLFMIGFLIEGFTYTWVRSRCHLATRAIASEKLLDQKLMKRRKRLNVELAHLKSPRTIAERAMAELGLRRPIPEQILRIRTKQ